jgi:hypothetical protein
MPADIASTLASWSTTEASNSPNGSTTIGGGLDENLRMIQAVVRQQADTGTIASAATTDLSTVANRFITVSGTVTITGLGTLSAGMSKWLIFSGALILTHNATSLILPGAANITTVAGNSGLFESLGAGNWKCLAFTVGAEGIANTPAGNIAATTVQAALNELDTEKALLAGLASQNFAANALTVASTLGVTGVSTLTGGAVITGASSTLGYGAGAGGTVTQATDKGTGVTLNKAAGRITMNAAALAAGAVVSFRLTNSLLSNTDVLIVNGYEDGAIGIQNYRIETQATTGGSAVIRVTNISGSSFSEAVIISFSVIKGATS